MSLAIADTHEFQLDNGIKIIVREDHRAPIVVSQIWYKVGSSYEHAGITGVSHALEHMMFKGSKNYPNSEFSRIIADNGGRENAFTGMDYTAYFQTMENSRMAVSFQLESDRMQYLLLPEDEFIKEIEVVKEERRWRTEDNPKAFTYEVAMSTAYQTSPYRNPVIGWMDDLNNLRIEDLRDWYVKWYYPSNATLVVVGDVEPQTVYSLAKKYFGTLPAGEAFRPVVLQETKQYGIKRVKVKRPAEVPYLIMAYKVPALKSAFDRPQDVPMWQPYALEMLSALMSNGNVSRLASRLIRGKEIAANASSSYRLATRLDNVFIFTATPTREYSTEQLEQALRKEIEDMKNNLVDESELDRIKTKVIAADIYGKDSIFYQALIIGTLETVGLSWRQADEYVERIKQVTPEQVQAVAKKYLVDDRLTVVTLDPQPIKQVTNTTPLPTERIHAY